MAPTNFRRWVARGKRRRSNDALNVSTNDEDLPSSSNKLSRSNGDNNPATASSQNVQQKVPLLKETDSPATLPPIAEKVASIPSMFPFAVTATSGCGELDEDPPITIKFSQFMECYNMLWLPQSDREQFRNQSVLEAMYRILKAQTNSSILELVPPPYQNYAEKDEIVAEETVLHATLNEDANMDRFVEPRDLGSTIDASQNCVRVSLERSSSRKPVKSDPVDSSSTTEESASDHETPATPQESIRADESVDIESDDASIRSTQTMDPTTDGLTDCSPGSQSPPFIRNTLFPSRTDKNAIQTPTVIFRGTERKPLQVTSANHANRKNPTRTDPGKPKQSGWVSNLPARGFLRQLDQRLPESFSVANTKPLNIKIECEPRVLNLNPVSGKETREEEPSYAYKEVVRKQCERRALNCYDCPNCQKFYAALRKSGHAEDIAILSRGGPMHRTAAVGNPGAAENASTRNSNVSFGRHRARFAQTETPEDFWELDFIDERDAATTPPKGPSKQMESIQTHVLNRSL